MATVSWHQACQLDSTLQSVTHFFSSPPRSASLLSGGLTNRCWKIVSQQGQAYVWRPISVISQTFHISRIQEYQVLKAVTETDIGPAPIFISESGLLVEWIEGRSLELGVDFKSLLQVQARIHSLNITDVSIAKFCFSERVDHYWKQLKSDLKTPDFERLYKSWRLSPNLNSIDFALCHFDLGGYNMITTDTGLRVIDWEYAALGDPRMDLALTIDVAKESVSEAVSYYCKLRNIKSDNYWEEGVLAWLPRTQMMAMLWYLLAFQLWGEEEYYQQALKLKDRLCSKDHCLFYN